MDVDSFWQLIEDGKVASVDPDGRLMWLTDQLALLPRGEIEDFHIHLDRLRGRVDTWLMWGAAYQICDSLCSDDGFFYFQSWLVGLGRERFELVAANPDALAELPEVQRLAGRPLREWDDDEWPDWEGLDYVASGAYERLTGDEEALDAALEAREYDARSSPDPSDERWDFEDRNESRVRLPRLSRMFPLTARVERDARNRAAFDRMLAERGQTEEEFFTDLGLRTPDPTTS